MSHLVYTDMVQIVGTVGFFEQSPVMCLFTNLDMESAEMLWKIYNWLQEQGRESGKSWSEFQGDLVKELDSLFAFTTNGDTGDYSNPEVQTLYLLRYLNCYAYEYMDMYRTFLKMYAAELMSLNRSRLFVTSFGYGNQIDLWGLCDAIRQINGPIQLPVTYTGVDINPWMKEFLLWPSLSIESDITDYINMTA